jgi:diguanylate cyclase (GGDEF)-like protein
VPSSGWFVVARLPTEEAFSTVGRVQKLIVRSGAISVAVVVLILGSFINWMLRPLHRAANEAERMTRGEIPLKALAVVRDDEVGHLTASFNRLLAKLVGSQAELERMAHHDTLTGLPNRSLLADRMQQALARALRSGTQIAVLYLDLDGFKPINDRFGHVVGDQALQEVARRLIAVLRQSDTLARVGGDEFVLLATDLEGSGENSVRILASRCIAVLAEPLLLGQIRCTLGVSIGIALCGGRCGPERLLVAADQAMYQAKEKGRGSYVIAPRCVDPGH